MEEKLINNPKPPNQINVEPGILAVIRVVLIQFTVVDIDIVLSCMENLTPDLVVGRIEFTN